MTGPTATLARRLGVFDVTMIVMGGIIGAGIFVNPAVVARRVGSAELALLAWAAGGAIALVGAFVYAELAARCPRSGGQYAYLREAYHPIVGFLYGWTLLLVVQTGGMAAAAVIFARYTRELTGMGWSEQLLAVGTLMVLTIVNCLGVRAGSNVQSGFMLLKLAAIAMLVAIGMMVTPGEPVTLVPDATADRTGFMTALVPILFAYGGWQTASFVTAELRDPRRDLARGLVIGVTGVIIVYLLVNVVSLRVLGADGLAASATPASDVMRLALGETGARLIALGIAISTVGFLSQSMLTAPRVYHAMAEDGVFFPGVAYVHPRTRAPAVAIALQGVAASVIALVGVYDRILNYVVSIDVLFFGLTAAALFVFRRRDPTGQVMDGARVPWHPWSTGALVIAFWAVAATTVFRYPADAGIGVGILLLGVPVYLVRARQARRVRDAG